MKSKAGLFEIQYTHKNKYVDMNQNPNYELNLDFDFNCLVTAIQNMEKVSLLIKNEKEEYKTENHKRKIWHKKRKTISKNNLNAEETIKSMTI